ncbi:hypothetical protein AKJ50_01180, partial [candidate division MSBL1 archaeon SCGC-AAA382A13]
RDNCDLVVDVGGIPRFYPKKGITLKRKGSWSWTEMLMNLIENPQGWLRDYHQRSNIETIYSTLKRDFQTRPRSRNLNRRG